MERRLVAAATILGLCILVGLTAFGALVGRALYRARAAERIVTVKGLSEREVPADLVLWPIVYSVTGDDLAALQGRVEEDAAKVRAFLTALGFDGSEMSLSAPRVMDREGQSYGNQRVDRYLVESTLTLRTSKIGAARAAIERSGDLVKQGVTLIRSYEYTTQYLFTGLEAIKPEMIAEATRDARRAAEQFANDSGSRVGAIRNAQQGYFSIEDRDPFSPEWKRIRVVTTVEYFLADE
jgi:hypothetical protein